MKIKLISFSKVKFKNLHDSNYDSMDSIDPYDDNF